MRVCPKCGYEDPPYWKQCAFRAHICYCRISDLELNEPDLAEFIKSKPYCSMGFYAYHLTKGGRVERQALCENPNWKTQWYVGVYERSKSNKLPSFLNVPSYLANKHMKAMKNQRRLLEEPAK